MRSTTITVAIGLLLIAALVFARVPVRSAAAWDGDQMLQVILTVAIVFIAALLAGGVLWLLFPQHMRARRRRKRR